MTYRFKECLVTGGTIGIVYFVYSLCGFDHSEQLKLVGSPFLRLCVVLYSLSVWFLAFCLLASLTYLIALPIRRVSERWHRLLGRILLYFFLFMLFAVGAWVWAYFENSPVFLPKYIMFKDLKRILLTISIVGLSASIAISFLVVRLSGIKKISEKASHKLATIYRAFIIFCACFVVFLNIAGEALVVKGGSQEDIAPERIVIYGIDAGTWNVILPLIEDGTLPTFRRLMEKGVYGYLDTYGVQFTPRVWTSIATGMKVEKHGVYHFGNSSTDWKAAPLWSIISDSGRRVAVTNWVCTSPPFKVNGAFITSLMSRIGGRYYFSEDYEYLATVTDSILQSYTHSYPTDDSSRFAYLTNESWVLRKIDEHIVQHVDPYFVAYYFYSPDLFQHFYWKNMEPEKFRSGDWEGEEIESRYSDAIAKAWKEADKFLSLLIDRYGENSCYFIVSDHGARPIKKRIVRLDLEKILHYLGLLNTTGGEVDTTTSTCVVMSGAENYIYRIRINPRVYVRRGVLDEESYHSVVERVSRALRNLKVQDGDRLFAEVDVAGRPRKDEPDITAYASKVILDFANRQKLVTIGEQKVPLSSLMKLHPWSGRHRARGIIFASGPGIVHRYVGAWLLDDPYACLFRYAHGTVVSFDLIFKVLRTLHLVDEATTLDIAPTILYLAGLPIARDMDGRVLTGIIEKTYLEGNPLKTVETYSRGEVVPKPATEDKTLKERLKALGYIQ